MLTVVASNIPAVIINFNTKCLTKYIQFGSALSVFFKIKDWNRTFCNNKAIKFTSRFL